MPYILVIPEHLDRIFYKISRKDKLQFEILTRKIKEILQDPYRFKPLTGNMTGQRRAHIRNFVLTFEIIEKDNVVKLLDYDHHDNIYS